MYDFLIVGAGIYGAVFAQQMRSMGKRCIVVERRCHIGGNAYSEEVEGIQVHRYGPHIFHTRDEGVWNYVNKFSKFNHFVYSPVANYQGEIYNLPFNMNTFSKMWGIRTPQEAQDIISRQIREAGIETPRNLEEQAISLVGTDIYEKLIKGYTEKQWGRPCSELPAFIIKRLPVRFTYDNNYFDHPYQGIPIGGYTRMLESMLDGIQIELGVEFLQEQDKWKNMARFTVYTGAIDEFYSCCFGSLQYRSLRFETEIMNLENYQGVAGMNYTDVETPYTRIVEHKHFEFGKGNAHKTVVTREYPQAWEKGLEAYYPVNDELNMGICRKYRELAAKESRVMFAGRLGCYRYMDMDQVIAQALKDSENFA